MNRRNFNIYQTSNYLIHLWITYIILSCAQMGLKESKQPTTATKTKVTRERRELPTTGPPTVVFLGGKMVGCSSIIRRFTFGLFYKDYKPEPGNIKHTKDVVHPHYGCYLTIQFCDVMGGDLRSGLSLALLAHAVVVIYDITKRTTFEQAQHYLEKINPRASVMLIGNKLDCEQDRRVSYKEGKLLARIHRVVFVELSAKSNVNIDESLNLLIMCIPDEYLFSKRKLRKLYSASKYGKYHAEDADEGDVSNQSAQ